MSDCSEIQERVALGEPLREPQRVHLSSCERCSLVAETYSQLDASFSSLLEPVPDGFADRVMGRLSTLDLSPARSLRWFDARWLELVLPKVALLCALLNALRFVASVLIPTVSLGASP